MTPQSPIDDILTITGINGGEKQYIDHNRAQWWGGGNKLTKIGMRSGGGGPRLIYIDHNRDPLCFDDPLSEFCRGPSNEKKIDQNREPPLFWSIWGPPITIMRKALIPLRGSQGLKST